MPRHGGRLFWILLLASLIGVRGVAQNVGPLGKGNLGNPESVTPSTEYATAPGTGVVVLHVFSEKSGVPLKGNVKLLLTNLANNLGLVQSLPGDTECIFPNVQPGNYQIEVGSFGYTSAYQNVQVIATSHMEPVEVVLHRDPSAVSLEVTDAVISPKARKEARHAVSLLKSGDLAGAQKHLEQAGKLAPSSSDVNFLLGYLYFQKKNFTQAETYLSTAAGLSPNSGKALALLGRTDLQLQQYPAARSALERAVLAGADNWTSHDLLADTYLQEKNYDKARDEAQVAISKGEKLGKGTTSPAEIVLAQALIALGRPQDAIQALKTFLKDSPQDPMAYQVSFLITELEKHKSSSASQEASTASAIDTSGTDPLAAVPPPDLSKTWAWRPPDVDDVTPSLNPGISCDTAHVVAESGKQVLDLVQDIARFAADEDLFHQSLDAFGFPTHTEIRKYDYVAMVSPEPAPVSVREYRSDKGTQEGDPDSIASVGFITLAFVFHPEFQKDFDFVCEGQDDWQGQPSWVVHFRQRSDRPNRMHSYSNHAGGVFPVDLKGRAWITANNFQIVKIEADIVKPVPEIQLFSERQTVEYGPVPFPTKNTTLWLPKKVEIYIDLRKHHYYRRHSFDHYLLFSVDTQEKPKVPEAKPDTKDAPEKAPS